MVIEHGERTWRRPSSARVLAILLAAATLSTAFFVATASPQAEAFPPSVSWQSAEHRYRVPLDINSSPGGTDVVAVADLNFTTAFVEAAAAGATFDPATLLVHEVDTAGNLVDAQVPFQFDADPAFDATLAASGELIIALPGATAAGATRHFVAYFEEAGVSTTPASVTPVLTVDTNAIDEGAAAVRVTNATADWYYDVAGGGFSSVLDNLGNDWVSYNSAAGTAGEYRGLPNLVFPAGHFHPGATSSTTTVTSTGPLRATLTSTTTDGWSVLWEFFETHARATVLTSPSNYWFLYEGTPGGSLDANDTVVRADGTVTNAADPFGGDFVGEEWVAFADAGVGQSLFLANHVDDASTDSYYALNGEMTVFGFGRDNLARQLTGTDRSFSVGIANAVDHVSLAPTVRAASDPPTVAVHTAENQSVSTFAVDATIVGGGTVTKSPDQPSYLDGTVVQLTATPDPGESFVGWSGDITSTNPIIDVTVTGASVEVTATFTLTTTGPTFVSDDFDSSTVGAPWTFVDPVGDSTLTATGSGSGQAIVEIAVAGGTAHDAWGANNAPRLMQPVDDTDFEIEAAFATTPSQRYQINGILIEQDAANWLRFDAFHDGTDLRIHAGQTVANASASILNAPVPATTRFFRLNRAQDTWTASYSSDGATWTQAGLFTFALTPTSAGVFAGNAGPSPAYTAGIDYAFNTASPVMPEDGTTTYTVAATTVGNGAVTASPDQASYVNGDTVELTAAPDAGETFIGWTGDITSTDPVLNLTIAGNSVDVTATFSEMIASSGFTSDDFNTPTLGAHWTFIDPVGDSSVSVAGTGSGQATAQIAVPAGTAHDAFGVNNSARIMQPIADTDFELEAAFESVPSQQYQLNGILVEADAANWLRFDVFHDGTELQVHALTTTSGVLTTHFSLTVPADTRFFRLNRTGSAWVGQYSSDGDSWTAAPTFAANLNVKTAGAFAGNAGPSPAYIGVVDYLIDTSTPIVPEDALFSSYPVTVTVAGNGSVTQTPDQSVYADSDVVQLIATASLNETFVGWTGDVISTNPAIDITIAGEPVNLTATFTETVASSGFVSDDFNTTALADHWTFVDPIGDGSVSVTGEGSGQATLEVSVPGGTPHDAYGTNNSARLMQSISDADFEIDLGFESMPSQSYQIGGLLVEQDPANWLRFDVLNNGTGLRVFAASTAGNTSATQIDVAVPIETSFLRLHRSGDTWTGYYSDDGSSWTAAGSFDFPLAPSSAGVFAANAGPSPAYTASFDFIFETTSPVSPEDGASFTVDSTVVGNGSVTRSPDQPAYLDGAAVELTAIPASGETFVGWTGDVTSTDPVLNVTISGTSVNVTATFTETVIGTGFNSDDFDASVLSSHWTFVDPVGDSSVSIVGAGTNQATANIVVPSGSNHDAFGINNAARLMQPIADVDFQLEAGFDSAPSQRYQINGILVEQDPSTWIRFDAVNDGASLRVYAGTTSGNSTTSRFSLSVPDDTRYFRLDRSGNTWTAEHSTDGTIWTTAGSFNFALTPTSAGVLAGNAGPNPGYTAVVDYIFDTASPVSPEDGAVAYAVNVDTTGDGGVSMSPDQASHLDGSTVQVTAAPDVGATFIDWTGDVTSTDPVLNLTIAGAAVSVTANFTTAPVTYPVDVVVVGNGSVTRTPDQVSYLDGAVAQLTANPSLGETFLGWTGDVTSADPAIDVTIAGGPVSVIATFSQSHAASGFVSDDFDNAVLNSAWSFVDPVGDVTLTSTGAGTGQALAEISVPSGSSHDAYGVNNSARLMQPINNGDFELEAGFAAAPAQQYQINGILVEQDAANWIRFDAYHDGTGLRVYAARTTNNNTRRELRIDAPADTRHFRLNRTGDTWTGSFSSDGDSWTIAGTFVSAMTVSTAGVFAGNAGGASPAYTSSVDYVFDTSAPIIPEDNAFDAYPVDITINGDGAVSKSPDQPAYPNGTVVQLTATPGAGSLFVGWTGDITSADPTIAIAVDGAAPSLTATFATSSSGFESDDFNAALLNQAWTFVDPVGDASYAVVGAGSGQATLELSVPAGTVHDAFNTNKSARILKPIADVDFELEAGFVSQPTQQFQSNGILIQQDASNWIRYDAYSDGANTFVFAATTAAGSSSGEFNVSAPADTRFLRMNRVGDLWTAAYSSDGVSWIQAGSFTFAITASSAGVFAGNAGPAPAYTAVVDYVFDNANPVAPEDGGAAFPINITTSGDGSVAKTPDQAVYSPGSIVQLTATPDGTETFLGWAGDSTSTNTIIDVLVGNGAVTLAADFTTAPPSYPIDVTISGSGTVSKSPDDEDYLNGSVVQLTATPHPGHLFAGWAGDITSTDPVIDLTIAGAAVSVSATFTPIAAASGFISDDFDSPLLGNHWTFVDPLNDATIDLTGAGSGQATFNMSVPGGTAHDAFGASNQAARIMQPISNIDFALEVGFVSVPNLQFQSNGILVEQDATNWIRFDTFSDGTDIHVFAARTLFGNSSSRFNVVVPNDTQFIRLNRSGDTWTGYYSPDGGAWTEAGSFDFAMAVTSAGVFVGNAGASPAYTSVIDYVFDTSTPIAPEDDTSTYALNVNTVGNGAVSKSPDLPTYDDGTIVQLSATPGLGETFVGWTGDVTSTNPVIDVTIAGAPVVVTATFTEPGSGSGFDSDDFDTPTLASHWTFIDPIGDSSATIVGDGSGQATLELSVPAGSSHDAWGANNNSARVVQPIADIDFDLEASFESIPGQQFQSNGILVEGDSTNWLRFDSYSDGGALRVFAATTVNGASSAQFNVIVPGDTSFLRLSRTTDTWSGYYSSDGVTWTLAGAFTHAIVPTAAGVFAGNAGPSPAYTAVVDYIFDTATPIVPEDGTTTYAVTTNLTGDGSVDRSPDQGSFADGATVQLSATPDPGASFIDWTGDVTSTNPVIDVTIAGAPVSVTANFTVAPPSYPINITTTGLGAVAKSPDQTTYLDGNIVQLTATPDAGETFIGWTGDIISTNPIIDVTVAGAAIEATANFSGISTGINVWYGSTQTFGDDGDGQRWVNVLGNASDPDGIANMRFRLNGGAEQLLNVGGDLRRIYNDGDFNVEIDSVDLSVGNNSVLIILNDSLGDTTTELVNVIWAPATPSTTYSLDWSTVADVQDGATMVDGLWGLDDGSIRTLETGYDRTFVVGDLSWENFEVEVPVTIHSLGPGSGTPQSGEPLVGLGLRWQGHSIAGIQPNHGFYPTGAFAWWRTGVSGNSLQLYGNNNSPNDKVASDLAFGTTYMFKARVETIPNATEYKYKVWEQGQSEPTTWSVEIIDTDSPATGSVVFIAHHFDVSFGNVTITPI